ncbi:MAG: ThuA domain-containing protein [Pirellulaceae bacterium]|nr:ThuA domain-containing protein [Pirellulaceae bacterium]
MGLFVLTLAFSCGLWPTCTWSQDAKTQDAKIKPIRALLVLGGCCHDYATQQQLLSAGITKRAHVDVTVAFDPDKTVRHLNPIYESADWAKNYDVVIHDECSSDIKDLAVIDRILEPHRMGLPAVILHCGMHCYRSEGYPEKVTPWFEFTGLQSTGHGPQQPIAIEFLSNAGPITKGMSNWKTINEELYNNSSGKLLDTATALARGQQKFKTKQGEEKTAEAAVVWTNIYREKTKVFATTLGHNNDTVADDRYLDLVTRGLLWSCGKLNERYLKPTGGQ